MGITLTHKVRLDPTHKQEEYFNKACGVARFTWNWALAEWDKQYRSGNKPTGLGLKKSFNAIKAAKYPWMYEVTKYAGQQPFIHLQRAFNSFFKKGSKYPRFKKKGRNDSFYIGNDHIKVEGRKIQIPKLGWVRMREDVRFSGKICAATISRTADKWFASLNVELDERPRTCESQAGVGVDLGIRHLASLSNGERYEGPRPLKKRQRKLKRMQRQLSRKQKWSSNRNKARMKVAKIHYRISCIRQDALHKLTTHLTGNFGSIAIEDLNVRGMMKNHTMARSIADMGFHEFRRQLSYKAEMRGNYVKIVWIDGSRHQSVVVSAKV